MYLYLIEWFTLAIVEEKKLAVDLTNFEIGAPCHHTYLNLLRSFPLSTLSVNSTQKKKIIIDNKTKRVNLFLLAYIPEFGIAYIYNRFHLQTLPNNDSETFRAGISTGFSIGTARCIHSNNFYSDQNQTAAVPARAPFLFDEM